MQPSGCSSEFGVIFNIRIHYSNNFSGCVLYTAANPAIQACFSALHNNITTINIIIVVVIIIIVIINTTTTTIPTTTTTTTTTTTITTIKTTSTITTSITISIALNKFKNIYYSILSLFVFLLIVRDTQNKSRIMQQMQDI